MLQKLEDVLHCSRGATQMTQLIVMALYFSHFNACFWFLLASFDQDHYYHSWVAADNRLNAPMLEQ
jgi:hypothetical protein